MRLLRTSYQRGERHIFQRRGDSLLKCIDRKKYRNGCEKTAFRKEFLENFVLENILRELSKPDTMNTIVNGLMHLQEMQNKENPILNTMLAEKRQTEKASNNLMSAIEQGIILNTTNKRLHNSKTN